MNGFTFDYPSTVVGHFVLRIGRSSVETGFKKQELTQEKLELVDETIDDILSGGDTIAQGDGLLVYQIEVTEEDVEEIVDALIEGFKRIRVWLIVEYQMLVPLRVKERCYAPLEEVSLVK